LKRKSLKTLLLQLDNLLPYERNLDKILNYLKEYKDYDLIVAPEVSPYRL